MKSTVKYGIEEARQLIEEEYSKVLGISFSLLDKCYKNSKTKLNIEGSMGYKYYLSVDNIRASIKGVCTPRKFYKGNIYTIENIKTYIVNNNLTCCLISEIYENNNKQKLEFKCACTNSFNTTLDEFLQHNKHQCNKCGRKQTGDFFKYDIAEVRKYMTDNSCELLTLEYKNSDQILDIKCSCGNIFKSELMNFKGLIYKCCDTCRTQLRSEKDRLISFDHLKEYIQDNDRSLISDCSKYINQHSDIIVKCSCGQDYSTTGNLFKYSDLKICPECVLEARASKKRNTPHDIELQVEKLSEISNKKHKWISGDYKNSKSLLQLEDEIGYEYQTTNCNIIGCISKDGSLMPFHVANPHTIYNINLWSVLNGDGYELISSIYINAKEKLTWNCCVHGEFEMNLDNRMQGNGCSRCTGDRLRELYSLSYNEVELRIANDGYKLISNSYINAQLPLSIMCDSGHTYTASLNTFTNGHRCPTCSETKGEKKCRRFMESNNLPFEPQYIFEDLLSDKGNPLKFDFAIFEDESKTKLKFLLEYDGEFHFMEVYKGDGHELIKYHDQLKINIA